MRSAAARAELPAHCEIHDRDFVRFSNGREFSFGCPVCVYIIREQVRKEREGFLALMQAGKRFKCVADDTGKRKAG